MLALFVATTGLEPRIMRGSRPFLRISRCSNAAASGSGARVVLIDDQLSLRKAVQAYLIQHGFQCDAFSDGSDALRAMLISPPPDVIVTDVLMPGLDGLSLLQRIKAEQKLCAVPLVLLTARGLTSDRIAGYNAGASVYLTKPFDPDELVAVVNALLSNTLLQRNSVLLPRSHLTHKCHRHRSRRRRSHCCLVVAGSRTRAR